MLKTFRICLNAAVFLLSKVVFMPRFESHFPCGFLKAMPWQMSSHCIAFDKQQLEMALFIQNILSDGDGYV